MSAVAPTQTVSTYLYKLVPATLVLTGTSANNVKFNTNIPFGMVMLIRRIRNFFFSSNPTTIAGNRAQTVAWELTEQSTLTSPVQSDPLALHTDAWGQESYFTANGQSSLPWSSFTNTDFLPPHPGVPTMAQQLNAVAQLTQQALSNDAATNILTEIYYELIVVNQQLKDYLANRISLQRV
jgi:hypothetical protein